MHYQNKSKSSFFGGEKRLFYAVAILLLMFATNLGCDSGSKKPSKAPSNGGKAGESPRTQTPPAKDSGNGSEDDDAEEDDGEDDDDKDDEDKDEDDDDDDKDEKGNVSSVKDFQKKYSLTSKGAVLVICGMRDADFRRIATYADRGRDRSLENLLSLRIRAARVDISDKDIDGIIETAMDVSDSSSKRNSLKKDCDEIVEKV